jgi:hypothetical protein
MHNILYPTDTHLLHYLALVNDPIIINALILLDQQTFQAHRHTQQISSFSISELRQIIKKVMEAPGRRKLNCNFCNYNCYTDPYSQFGDHLLRNVTISVWSLNRKIVMPFPRQSMHHRILIVLARKLVAYHSTDLKSGTDLTDSRATVE